MNAIKKAKSNESKKSLQASTLANAKSTNETLAKPKRGFKRHSEDLAWIIRLVNSLPANPPRVTEIPERMDTLLPELRSYLDSEYESAMVEEDGYRAVERMQSSYLHVIDMNENLRQLMRQAHEVSDEQTIYFHEAIDAGAYLEITKDRKVKVSMSMLARAIEGVDIDYLRYCETCRKIFYAGRKNQPCCTVKCAKALRQKRWRRRYKEGYYQA